MTINTATITSGPYTGNGVTTDFSYTFRVENKNQLTVYETTAMGVQSTLTVDTDYTVNNVGTDGGGTITRVAGALPSGYTWYIRSNYNTLQETDFESQGSFYPAVHEAAFDKITFLIQQLYDLNTRSFRLSDSDPDGGVVDLSLPTIANRANRVLIFDENGDLGVGSSIGTIRGNWVTGTQYFVRDLYIDESTSNVYFVEANHVATSIAADIASGYVTLLIDAEIVTTKAAEAAASAAAASSSESAAAASEALAEKWAEEDEDVEVEPGLYSAKHYAIKAEDAFATGAAGSVSYDNATSGLTATNVQDAIDEVIDDFDARTFGISGLVVTNNAVDLAHDIDVSTGYYNSYTLASPLTKQLDAAFAEGSGNGGMIGTLPASGVVYIFLISKDSDGTIDVYAETTDGTNPPSGWTIVKRIAVRTTDASNNLIPVTVAGNGQQLRVFPVNFLRDFFITTVPTVRTAYPVSGVLSCPPNVIAEIQINMISLNSTEVIVNSTTESDHAPSTNQYDLRTSASGSHATVSKMILIDSNRQLALRRGNADISVSLFSRLVSWIEDRS
tara:strand:+ start:399 stop:2075 length:1677 start_codon:yes stop_codon:yes gene_type:complete